MTITSAQPRNLSAAAATALTWRTRVAVGLIGTALLLPPAFAAKQPQKKEAAPHEPAAASSAEITDKQADLQELRSRIEALRKDLASSEGDRASAADRLRESERQISTLQRELYRLSSQRNQLQDRLKDLGRQSQELEATLAQQQSQLEKLLYRHYLRGTPDSLQLLLNGDDPNQIARDLHYLGAIARTRAELLGEINANLARKKTLAGNTREQAEELAAVEAEQKKQHDELAKQREERKSVLAQVSDRVRSQRKEIGNLQENEKRMTQLIDRLSKVLAAQAAARAAEAARAAKAAQAAQAARSRPSPHASETEALRPADKTTEPSRPRSVEPENHLEPVASSGNFARLKGNLRLPARGTVAGRFGGSREGGGTWKGLFIRAGSGSDVKAVATGRVVFSEWMRGFGNLLIVDHGDAYLSIYGNNDSLLKQVGEAVKGGETIATVGNSGGNPESGLYFEIRHQGQPIDPMKWASLK